jgi:hypothetical protein
VSASFEDLERSLAEIRDAGLWKDERVIAGPQGAEITLVDGRRVLNFCATTTSASRAIRDSSPPRTRRSTRTATA